MFYAMTYTMDLYQQMEFYPIYSTSCLIGWLTVGGLILRELDNTTGLDFIILAIGVLVAMVGTQRLTSKRGYGTTIETKT